MPILKTKMYEKAQELTFFHLSVELRGLSKEICFNIASSKDIPFRHGSNRY